MNYFRGLRRKFDDWRKERLDKKLLAIRMRYEDDSAYTIRPEIDPDLAPDITDEDIVEASALFMEGEEVSRLHEGFSPAVLPPKFLAKEVIGMDPSLDTKTYNEAMALTYGPLDYQHSKLVESLRNDLGQPYGAPNP